MGEGSKKVKQNKDSNGGTILAMKPLPGGTEAITTGNQSAAEAGCNAVRLLATSGTPRVRFGDTGVTPTAADILLVEGLPEYFSIDYNQFVAVIDGTVEMTRFVTG
jgi:hypothetical protein